MVEDGGPRIIRVPSGAPDLSFAIDGSWQIDAYLV